MAPGLDGDAGAEDDVGFDEHVAADAGVEREEHRLGRDQRDPCVQRLGALPRLEGGLGLRELGAGVDAEGLGLGAAHHVGGEPVVAQEPDEVGEVVLALGVLLADPLDQAE